MEQTQVKPCDLLLKEFGSYRNIAEKLGVAYQTAYSYSFRPIPHKHLDKLVELSEGRLNKEMLRPQ